MYFVYMLLSLDKFKHTYVGYTKNLSDRLKLHNCGKGAKYTKGRSWKIIYSKKSKPNVVNTVRNYFRFCLKRCLIIYS